jgi:hypothetical protein
MSPITFAPTFASNSDGGTDSSGQEDGRGGYEEDNEDDETDDPEGGSSRGRSNVSSRILPQPDPNAQLASVESNEHSASTTAGLHTYSDAYDPDKFTMVRFSTGQLLDDDQAFESYAISPYELFEIHRAGAILRLPRDDVSKYAQPYWEGNANALREVRPSGRPRGQDGSKPKRTTGLNWRPRWVTIHQDTLSLRKSADVSTTLQLVLFKFMIVRTLALLRRFRYRHYANCKEQNT